MEAEVCRLLPKARRDNERGKEMKSFMKPAEELLDELIYCDLQLPSGMDRAKQLILSALQQQYQDGWADSIQADLDCDLEDYAA